jgi:succinate dehydrogenase / fumarate reductase flavoprotein subunit
MVAIYKSDVVIVGAGLAGLAAARELVTRAFVE